MSEHIETSRSSAVAEVIYQQCVQCGLTFFPSRYRCSHCAGHRFAARATGTAQVSCYTHVLRRPADAKGAYLVELTQDGLTLLAVADFEPAIGERLSLTMDADGAIQARRPEDRTER